MIYPDTFVSTKEAYDGCKPKNRETKVRNILENHPVEKWQEVLFNDFENWIFPKFPQLAQVKQKLYDLGASYASMTGSGATLYGLFKEPLNDPETLFPSNYRVFYSLLS
jgi:4-diphosphocytidyl-2-C-methyl-D-erythritol kinase